jgi:hypothetical protein
MTHCPKEKMRLMQLITKHTWRAIYMLMLSLMLVYKGQDKKVVLFELKPMILLRIMMTKVPIQLRNRKIVAST